MMQPPPPDDSLVARQPVAVFLTGLAGLVNLGLVAADAMNWVSLQPVQTGSLVAFVTAACSLVGITLHAKVWAPATVAQLTAPSAPEVLP